MGDHVRLWTGMEDTLSVSVSPAAVSVPTITGPASWETGTSGPALGGAWGGGGGGGVCFKPGLCDIIEPIC